MLLLLFFILITNTENWSNICMCCVSVSVCAVVCNRATRIWRIIIIIIIMLTTHLKYFWVIFSKCIFLSLSFLFYIIHLQPRKTPWTLFLLLWLLHINSVIINERKIKKMERSNIIYKYIYSLALVCCLLQILNSWRHCLNLLFFVHNKKCFFF